MLRSSSRLIGIGSWKAKLASTSVCRRGLLHQTQTQTQIQKAVSRGRGFSLSRGVSAAGTATSGSRGVEPGVGAGGNNDARGVRGGANVVNPRGGKVNEAAESANQMYRSPDEAAIPLPQEKQAVDMDSAKGSSGGAAGGEKNREDGKSTNPNPSPRARPSSISGSGSGSDSVIGRGGGGSAGVGSTSGLGGSSGTSSAGPGIGKLSGPRAGGGPGSDTPTRQVSNSSSSSSSRFGPGKQQERQNLKEDVTPTNEERQGAAHTRSGTTPTSSEWKTQQQQKRPLAAEERERTRSNQIRGSGEHQRQQQQQEQQQLHERDAVGLSSISGSNSTFSSMDPVMAHRSAPDAADRPQGSTSEQFVAADRAEADPLINRTGRAATSPQTGTVPDTRGL